MSPAALRHPGTWTLRTQVLASVLALFTAVMLASGVATILLTRDHLTNQLTADLTNAASRVGGGPIDPHRHDGDDGPAGLPGGGAAILRLGLHGGAIAIGPGGRPVNNVVDMDNRTSSLSAEQVARLENASLGNQPRRVDLGGRVGSYLLVAHQQADGDVVITGVPTWGVDRTVEQLVNLVGGSTLLGLVIVGLGGNYLIRRNLQPLSRVAATARQVSQLKLDSGDVTLPARVPAMDADGHTEVGQVGLALNNLLDNVEGALQTRHESEMRVRQFVADASHELRTPLASIRGYAELTRRADEPVPATVSHAIGRVESEALRMQGLVEDLLLLARLDSGRPLEREPVDLTLMAMDLVSDARAASPDHAWELDLPEEPVEVPGDRFRLHQILANLLANARTHTPPGTRVATRLRPEGDFVRLSVHDDGPGIPAEEQPKVFERFTRGDDSRNRASGTTGLGLSIVAAVGQAHGGRVELQSKPGDTTFSVLLPAT
jgi:two-component system OmpR family sensor kinase